MPDEAAKDEAARIELDFSTASMEAIELFLDETADDTIFSEILDANTARSDVIEKVLAHPETPEEIKKRAERMLAGKRSVAEIARKRTEEIRRLKEKEKEQKDERLIKKIQNLSISGKIKLAMKGNSEIRKILAREPGKLIILAVLSNSKINDGEVAAIARNRAVIEDALRVIAKNRDWMKSYAVQVALAANPKTPLALAMQLVPHLKKKDIASLSRDKSIPEGVRTMARKIVKGVKD